jgi:hypothetical protein
MNDSHLLLSKLAGLRTELVDLAFQLECQGRVDAADIAVTTSARIQEICSELAPSGRHGGNLFAESRGAGELF